MTLLPERSPGVLLSALGEQVVAYDLVTETAHNLNASAGTLLAACDGNTDRDDAIVGWAEATGADPAVIDADVNRGLETLRQLGLIERTIPVETPTAPTGTTVPAAEGSVYGQTHAVVDWAITFRSRQPDLLATIDSHLGTAAESTGTPLVFDVSEQDDGQVLLISEDELLFPHLESCLQHLVTVINQYAVWTYDCAALHAASVRSPHGDIVLLPAPSGAGKSTLAAALVVAGWDYLGDEAIGVRPTTLVAVGYPKRLALDAASRRVLGLPDSTADDLDPTGLRFDVVRLGGDVGPVTKVFLPAYSEHAEVIAEVLKPPEALVALLANTLNLRRAGQPALDALCDLATTTRVQRLTHGDAGQAVDFITAESGTRSTPGIR